MSEMSSSSVAPESGRKSALIVEGGAMRGAWAAGVLAFLYERGMNRYDMVYAASSGAWWRHALGALRWRNNTSSDCALINLEEIGSRSDHAGCSGFVACCSWERSEPGKQR